MRLFTRRREATLRDPDLPLSVDGAQRLRETMRWAFLEAGIEVSLESDHVVDGDGRHFPLDRVAEVCSDAPVGEWASLARIHVRHLLDPTPEVSALSDADLAGLVRLQLMARDELHDASYYPISPGPTPELVELVTLHLPDSIATPPESEFGVREGGLSRWREIARTRLAEHLFHEEMQHERIGMDESDAFHVISSDSDYTASFSLLLPELMARLEIRASDSGVLLAVPSRRQLAFRVVDGPDATLALHQLFRFAMSRYDEGPGRVSPHVFWVYDDRWTQATTIEDGQARVSVDEELAEALGLGED
jgi:hypothetical protein